MDKQWSYFEEALGKMKSLVGDSETNRVIKNAVFVISAGTNDMIFNVYDHVLGSLISVSDYQDSLLTKVEVFVQVSFNVYFKVHIYSFIGFIDIYIYIYSSYILYIKVQK